MLTPLTPQDKSALRLVAEAAEGAKFAIEGLESIVSSGTWYGALIMHEDGERIIAQCVTQPWANFIGLAHPYATLALLDEIAAMQKQIDAQKRLIADLEESDRTLNI